MKLEYELTEADFAAAVALMTAPTPLMKRIRPALLIAIWFMHLLAAGCIGVIVWGIARTRCPSAAYALRFGVFVAIWLGLLWVTWGISRDPEGLQRPVRDWLTRRLLRRLKPGPRTLTIDELGWILEGRDARHAGSWKDARRAVCDPKMLVLASGRVWVIVPFARLSDLEKVELIRFFPRLSDPEAN